MSRIEFYKVSEPCGEFSNFAPFPIELDGKLWPSSEHYFQAQKFIDLDHIEAIRAMRSPMSAARMGRSRSHPIRDDWDDVKDAIMHKAVTAKFSQHEALRQLLLATGEAEIIEHTKNDSYWGDGGDESGQNKLGKILMQVRSELQTCDRGSLAG
jgi:ribA/ribD-fused uncharacterized protein